MHLDLEADPGKSRRRAPRAAALFSLALGLAAFGPSRASDWTQFQAGPDHPGVNASETAFTPGNVADLKVVWRGHIGSDVTTEGGSAIAGPILFVTGFDGKLSAFPSAGCGARDCQPSWQGSAAGDITSTPAVADGRVVFASADHFVHVFDAAGCGAEQCEPLWRGQLSNGSIDSSVAIAGGMIFVGDFSGQLSVFPLAGCGADVCAPAWTAQADRPNEQIDSAPTVGNGFVYVQTSIAKKVVSDGRLLVFPAAGCGQPTCRALWSAELGGMAGFTSSPVIVGDKVIVGSERRTGGGVDPADHLVAFAAAGCGADTCRPVQFFDVGTQGVGSTPAVSGTMLFVSSNETPGHKTVGVVSAFDLSTCGTHCKPVWTGVNPSEGAVSPPAVAGDVVFVGKGPASFDADDAGVYAFDVHGCGRPQCRPLAFVQSSPQAFYLGAPLAIAQDRIAFVSMDNATLDSNVAVIALPLPPRAGR
jgi:outer membrane protein assembly factor BamB